jgi:chorismate mutase
MPVRGIRGAITVNTDTRDEVLKATTEMLEAISAVNPGLNPKDIASAFFTVTDDIRSAFPAEAARYNGWRNVPRLCAKEIPVKDGLALPLCIRVLLHWNTETPSEKIKHVYLRDARKLRPDLVDAAQEN